jgi:3-dehydroquinate synthase
MDTTAIQVKKRYTVHIGNQVLQSLPVLIKNALGDAYFQNMRVLIVSDKKVAYHYLRKVSRSLRKEGFKVHDAVFRGGERLKSHKTLQKLLRIMVKKGLTRDSLVIGLGGGVIGDFAGFAASIYMRGCGVVHVPTSLLAQVDSSVGGKVGINLSEGKNLIGSFHRPLLVLNDISVLYTLPQREFLCGLAEIMKYGLIFNRKLFEHIDAFFYRYSINNGRFSNEIVKRVLLNDPIFLENIITKSVKIKADIVSKDERESDIRMILNFGHTFGHAIEQATRYRRFLHGEAVLLGMKMASVLSEACKLISTQDLFFIRRLLDRFEVPSVKGLTSRQIMAQIERDKKKRGGKIHYILLKEIGYAVWETEVAPNLVKMSIEKVLEEHKKDKHSSARHSHSGISRSSART